MQKICFKLSLVLHDTIVLATCLAILETEVARDVLHTLQSRTAACNGSKKIAAIVAKGRVKFNFVQSLQAQKVARQVAETT